MNIIKDNETLKHNVFSNLGIVTNCFDWFFEFSGFADLESKSLTEFLLEIKTHFDIT